MSIIRLMDKKDEFDIYVCVCVCVCIHNRILLSHRKNEIMSFVATWTELEIIILNQSKRERQILYDIAYIWNLKHDTEDLSIKQKQTHRHSKQTCGFQEGGSRIDWEFGIVVLSRLGRVQLFAALRTVACQAPLSMGFSRQEYWSGLPCPPPGDLPHPGIESLSLMSPALTGKFFTTSATWEATYV